MLNRSLLIEAGKGDFVTVVCVDRLECKSVKEEQLVRKNPIKVKVEPQDYVEFVEELVESGWHLSEGAKT